MRWPGDSLKKLEPMIRTVRMAAKVANLSFPGTSALLENGDLIYDSSTNAFRARVGSTTRYLIHDGNINTVSSLPKGYVGGPAPVWAAVTGITLLAGIRARNSTNTDDIELAGNVTLSLAVSGAAGLDTGAEASNTFYYVYLIKNPTSGVTSAVFSSVNEKVSGSITLPSGYTLKAQLPYAVRNDASSNVIRGVWQNDGTFYYSVPFFRFITTTAGTTAIVSAGTAAAFTSASFSSFIPANCIVGYFSCNGNSTTTYGRIRTNSTMNNDTTFGSFVNEIYPLDINGVTSIEYIRDSGSSGVYVEVAGYKMQL